MPTSPLLRVVGADAAVPVIGGGTAPRINLDHAGGGVVLESVAAAVAAELATLGSVDAVDLAAQVGAERRELAGRRIAAWVGARHDDSVVFTRGAADAFGLLASVAPGESVVLDIEHDATLLPWLSRGARVLPSGRSVDELLSVLGYELKTRRAAIVAIAGANAVTGERLPLRELATLAHRYGARLAVDATQLLAHRRVLMLADGVDYLAISGATTYAPYGIGALVGRGDWLGAARGRFAGTPDSLGIAALAASVAALASLDERSWAAHGDALRRRLVDGLAAIRGAAALRIFDDSTDPVGIVGFSVAGLDPLRAAGALAAERAITVGAGSFGSPGLVARLGGAVLRASFGAGTVDGDIDRLLDAVDDLASGAPRPNYAVADGQWVVAPEVVSV
jgi:selenocysteine lyase/cysteine desulfurase